MVSALRRVEPVIKRIAGLQGGVITGGQLRAARFTPGQVRAEVKARRWQALLPGVYLTHTGTPSAHARIWAAVLHCGQGAVVTGATALWLAGASPANPPPNRVSIAIPETRRAQGAHWITVVRRRHLERDTAPQSSPPRVSVEAAALEATAQLTSPGDVLGVVFGAIQRRRTTAQRLRAALDDRRGHRWSGLLRDVLEDAADGVQSPLEHRYVGRVERAHGLPPGEYNHADRDSAGRRRYRDVKYRRWRLLVELDGREAHPREWAHRDRRRDNDAALQGHTTLRYGWREIEGDACGAAGEIARGLRSGGWGGAARRCGPGCTINW